jgi:hypothetical protein
VKITIESTSEIVTLNDGVQARVWEGETESGVKVQCLITRIAALKTDDLSQFDRELNEQREPIAAARAFPLRMLI